jgi:hypothetical protein
MIQRLREYGIISMLIAATFALIQMALLFNTAAVELKAARQDMAKEASMLRQQVVAEVKTLNSNSDAQATALRADVVRITEKAVERLDGRMGEAISRADERLLDATGVIDANLSRTNNSLEAAVTTASGFRQDVQPTLHNVASITGKVDTSATILLDCKTNSACLPSQTLALVGSWRHTSGQIAIAAPEFTKATTGIAVSLDSIAASFAKPEPLWKKLVGATTLVGRWFL